MSDIPACVEPRRGDLLAAYELGLLEDQERRAFEQHLDSCRQCLEELYALAPAAVLLREQPGRFAAAVEAGLQTARTPAGRVPRTFLARWLESGWLRLLKPRILAPAVAVAVLLVLFIAPTLRQGPSQGDLADLADLAIIEPLSYARIDLRGGTEEGVRLFQQGMDHYGERRYAEAAEALAAAAVQLDRRSPTAGALPAGLRDQTHLYLGVSLLLEGRADAAAEPLTIAAASALPPLADRGRWYLAQAYLLGGQGDSARSTLTLLQASPVYGPQARRQLDALQGR